jgi:selenocysteine lyase/cysteine desulfurase
MTRPLDADQFRAQFPGLTDTVHLATCSQAAQSSRLAYALQDIGFSLRERGAPWELWMAKVDSAREWFARLIGADATEIAVLSCASEGAFQAASSLDWSMRSGIITTDLEFPSIAQVWLAQRARGATVRVARDTGVAVAAEAYTDLIDESVNLVSVPLVSYHNGSRAPVRAIAAQAHAQGARVFVDAYQAAGVLPIDVRELGCDYLVAGSLKYLLGLPGIAFLYVRGGLEHQRDPELTGWFGQRDPFDFNPRRLEFAESARRFETGTPPVLAAYAADAGFDLLDRIDVGQAYTHVAELVGQLSDRLAGIREQVASPRAPAQRGPQAALRDDDPDALAAWLAARKIVTAPRGRLLRLSLHYYNNSSDVDTVVDAIRRYRKESD